MKQAKKSQSKKLNRKILFKRIRVIVFTLLFLTLATAGIYAGYRALTGTASTVQPLTMKVDSKPFTLKIQAAGELQSSESVAVAVPNVPVHRLRISAIVGEGVRVNKGDVLAEFDPSELDLKIMEHRSEMETVVQKMSKGELASEVDRSDVIKDRKIAELELQKISEFLPRDEQVFAQREIIEGRLDKEYTEKKIVLADAKLELKGKVYSLEEAILMLERGQATARKDQAEKALGSLKLISPASGIVVYNDPGFFFGGYALAPGTTVYIGMTFLNLVNPEKMEARCYVLEKDAGELRTGQSARVTLDPFPGMEFSGTVKNIDNLARPIDRDSPVKYFQTVITLNENDKEVMKPGVKLKTEIVAGELKDVIVVPRSAVIKKEAGFVAYVEREPGQFNATQVTLGQGDLIQVVVNEGLEPGQTLALNPPDVKRSFTDKDKKSAEGNSSKSP
jgi:multidrug efflux pump subunit AcrA (membrane-fusion protein)